MKYNESVFLRAENIITDRRVRALTEYESRKQSVSDKYPEIKALNEKIENAINEITDVIELRRDNTAELIERIGKENLEAQKTRKKLLSAFGYPEDYLDIPYTCKRCKDSGLVEGIRCSCFDEVLKKCAVTELTKNCAIELKSFDDFSLEYYEGEDRNTMQQNLDICKRYASKFTTKSPSLFLIGETGLGKTLLSSAIAKVVLSNGFSVAFDNISEFLRKIENEHFGRSAGDTLELLTTVDLVILDDLGSEFPSSFTQSAIYSIINTRLGRGLPTIISTNFTFDELRNVYNNRIISRIEGQFEHLDFKGEDVRLQKNNK